MTWTIDVTLELTTQDLFTLASSMVTAVALGITAGLGFKLARYRGPAQRAFSATLALGAYYVFCVGFSHGGVGREVPLLYASTQLLSGYIGPFLYFFCLSVADPLRKPNRWYLLAGVPGTIYALYLFTQPDSAAFLSSWATEKKMPDHPIAVPLFMAHSAGLITFALWSYALVFRQWLRARPGDHRAACGWLVAALSSVLLILVVANVLPLFGMVGLIPFSSLILIPVAAMAYRALWIESTASMTRESDGGDRLLSRVESMGRVGRALVHDVNNMLTAIVCHAELGLLKKHDSTATAEHFREIQAIGTRAGAMHDRLISFSGKGGKTPGMVHLNAIIEETISAMGPQIPEGTRLETRIEPDLPPVKADADDLHRALTNLLLNGVEAIEGDGGRITLTAQTEQAAVIPRNAVGRQLDGSPAVLLEVMDNGCGMAPETVGRVFEPFFSTKGSERGLGLLSVMAVVRDAGGGLSYTSTVGDGCTFRLWLPLSESPVKNTNPGSRSAKIRTTLVVDDDEQVRQALEEVLSLCGVDVSVAVDGVDALERIKDRDDAFDLALIDVRMPRMDGLELIAQLKEPHRPGRIVLVSGDEPRDRINALTKDGVEFMRKPLNLSQLCAALGLELPSSAP